MGALLASAAVLAMPAGAGVGRAGADVTLQIVPRGSGTVTSDVAGARAECTSNEEPDFCERTVTSGSTVVLSPKPTAGSAWRWSVPDCQANTECRLTVSGDTTVTVLFQKLTLRVSTSGADAGDTVTSTPPGINCGDDCEAEFNVGDVVTLTAAGNFTSFPFGCTAVNARQCTVTVLDDPQTVGVKFNNAEGPGKPSLVEVRVRVEKGGDGTGRITAGTVDCGDTCDAAFTYGDLTTFTAIADDGSTFGGWGGICADDRALTCRLPVGPITVVRPQFARGAKEQLRVTLVSAPAARTGPARVAWTLRSTLAARGSAAVLVRGRVVASKAVALRAGTNAMSVKVKAAVVRSGGRVRLRVADPAGGTRTFSWAFKGRR